MDDERLTPEQVATIFDVPVEALAMSHEEAAFRQRREALRAEVVQRCQDDFARYMEKELGLDRDAHSVEVEARGITR